MKELLLSVLETLGYPIYLQGSLNPNEPYPDSMFTFWNRDTWDDEFYDNKENVTIWQFDVNFYSIDPTLVNSVLVQAKNLLRQNGFIVDGKGHDIASDNDSQTGRGLNVYIIEK